MDTAQKQTVPFQHLDPDNAIKLSETRQIIDGFFYDLCGLHVIPEGDKHKLARISRPTFTYEFAKDLCTRIYIEANRITARTVYDRDKIKVYLYKQCDTMAQWFTVVGIHKLISEKAWQKILDLAELDPDTIEENPNTKKMEGMSFWLNKYNINWHYDLPVNDDMLRIVKEEYGLDGESFGQDTILRTVFWSIRIFLEGGINRSRETPGGGALTLDHEKMIHKEQLVMNQAAAGKADESFMDKIKRGVGNFLGSNR